MTAEEREDCRQNGDCDCGKYCPQWKICNIECPEGW